MGDHVYFILYHIKGHIMSISPTLSNDRFDHLIWAFRNNDLETQCAHWHWSFPASVIPKPCSEENQETCSLTV